LLKPTREESELREERYDPSKKSIPSDWRKSKEFVEQDAELYGRSQFQRNPMSSGGKLGDKAASQLASRATLANHCPINEPKNENIAY